VSEVVEGTGVPFPETPKKAIDSYECLDNSLKGGPLIHAAKAKTAVLLDEHPLWLGAVETVLHRLGIEVVGKATSPKEALALVEETRPDLLLAELPDTNGSIGGAGLLIRARQLVPHLQAIVLSAHAERHRIDSALKAGAAAYVLKTAHAEDLASAVRQSFDPSVFLAKTQTAPAPIQIEDASAGLTRREREILRLVAEGHSNAELAKMLWVTEQTVKFHLSNIYRKLEVANRTEASRWAQLHGLLPDPAARPLAATA
jgi:NarL family two-component system response regulator LiaR